MRALPSVLVILLLVGACTPDNGSLDRPQTERGGDLGDGGTGASDTIQNPEADRDGDGIPDGMDDSDGDGIRDFHEGPPHADPDGDGLSNWEDEDSDGDGIPDAEEAGDDDPSTPPIDSDFDGDPDAWDYDSDNDGLSDADERTAGTDRRAEDSDADGVSDLVETVAETNPLDDADNPRSRGNFFFLVPFEEPPMPERDTLGFRTNIQVADVYFVFDTTGSMSGEINAMRAAVTTVVDDLTCQDFGTTCTETSECGAGQTCSVDGRCIEDPSTTACIASLWTGVGGYKSKDSYTNYQSLTGDANATRDALPRDTGGGSEALFETAACVADPSVCRATGCTPGGIGCPSYREEAVRVMVLITDERDECGDCSPDGSRESGMYLREAGITFVGVDADPGEPWDRLNDLARDAESFDSTGRPLVFRGDGPEVSGAVTEAIREIVQNVPIRVTIEATDEPGDSADALAFIDHLEVNVSGTDGCSMVSPTEDTDGDGFDDAFPAVQPGTEVCWDIVAATNTAVEPTDAPQVFTAKLTVKGDGSPLDNRLVYFLVPPALEVPVLE